MKHGLSTTTAGLLTGILAVVAHPALAAKPIPGGHYELNTPQSKPGLLGWSEIPDEHGYGKGWSVHVHGREAAWTNSSWIEVAARCNFWQWQRWEFSLDGVRINTAGYFTAVRTGTMTGFDGIRGMPEPSEGVRGALRIVGQFKTRRRARGVLTATSTDGCSSGTIPFVAVYRRAGWEDLLNRL